MPSIHVTVACPIHDSFRVQQVAGMFDVPLEKKATERFEADVPGLDEAWQIGLIVGPSGSGKSTIARKAFGETLYHGNDWPADRAVVDCFSELSVRHVVELFTAVGFGSPPSWVKPYQVLSNGKGFVVTWRERWQSVKSQELESRARGFFWLSTLDSKLSTFRS